MKSPNYVSVFGRRATAAAVLLVLLPVCAGALTGTVVANNHSSNVASADFAAILGGQDNTANGEYATIAGGFDNGASNW